MLDPILSQINPIEVLKNFFFISVLTFLVSSMHNCVSPLFSSGHESSVCLGISRLSDACYNPRFVDVVLLRTILSSCITLAGEAYKLVARRAREYSGTSSSSFAMSVTAFSYSWHQRHPLPFQYLSQFEISLNTIKQRHPQARASVTLNISNTELHDEFHLQHPLKHSQTLDKSNSP